MACLGKGPPSPSGSSPVSLADDDEELDDDEDEDEEEGCLFLKPSVPSSVHSGSYDTSQHNNTKAIHSTAL